MGRRGTVAIASDLREFYGFEDGAQVIQEPRPEGVLLRPAVAIPVRLFTDVEKATFILNAASDAAEYAAALAEVKALGKGHFIAWNKQSDGVKSGKLF